MIPDFKKKQKRGLPHNNIILILSLILGIIVFIILIIANIKIYQKKQELSLQLKNLEKQTQEIKKNNAQIQDGINKATDNDYIEKIAREQLNLQKNNESTAIFLMPETQEEKLENKAQSKNWFIRLWDWIIAKF